MTPTAGMPLVSAVALAVLNDACCWDVRVLSQEQREKHRRAPLVDRVIRLTL